MKLNFSILALPIFCSATLQLLTTANEFTNLEKRREEVPMDHDQVVFPDGMDEEIEAGAIIDGVDLPDVGNVNEDDIETVVDDGAPVQRTPIQQIRNPHINPPEEEDEDGPQMPLLDESLAATDDQGQRGVRRRLNFNQPPEDDDDEDDDDNLSMSLDSRRSIRRRLLSPVPLARSENGEDMEVSSIDSISSRPNAEDDNNILNQGMFDIELPDLQQPGQQLSSPGQLQGTPRSWNSADNNMFNNMNIESPANSLSRNYNSASNFYRTPPQPESHASAPPRFIRNTAVMRATNDYLTPSPTLPGPDSDAATAMLGGPPQLNRPSWPIQPPGGRSGLHRQLTERNQAVGNSDFISHGQTNNQNPPGAPPRPNRPLDQSLNLPAPEELDFNAADEAARNTLETNSVPAANRLPFRTSGPQYRRQRSAPLPNTATPTNRRTLRNPPLAPMRNSRPPAQQVPVPPSLNFSSPSVTLLPRMGSSARPSPTN